MTLSRGIVQQRDSMEKYFKDKRFIVTGASSGMYKIIVMPIYNKNMLCIYNLQTAFIFTSFSYLN
jgi:hypothetical protein